MRKAGTVLTSLRTSKCTCKAKILTLGMMVHGLTLVPACDVNVQMQRTESEIKITHLIPGQLLNETEGKLGLQFIYCTSMMVLPICSSCCPGGQYPSIRRLGALPILIVENLLPPMRRVISRKNLSRRGASATVMSPKEDMPSCRHRRLRLAKQRRTSLWLAMIVRTSRTGLLSSRKARS